MLWCSGRRRFGGEAVIKHVEATGKEDLESSGMEQTRAVATATQEQAA